MSYKLLYYSVSCAPVIPSPV